MRPYHLFTLLFILFLHSEIVSQAKFNAAVSGRFTVGTQFTTVQNYGIEEWYSGFGKVACLDPALKLRWKNSFAWSFGVGFHLYTYAFTKNNSAYDVYYLDLKYESHIYKYIETHKGPFDYLSFGVGGGITPVNSQQLTKQTQEFRAVTTTLPGYYPFYSPHIGTYRREDRFGYSLELQYTKYLTETPLFTFDLTSTYSDAKASSKAGYLGINITVDYDLRKKKAIPTDKGIELQPDLLAREKEVVTSFEFRNRNLKIIVWDHGLVDHDTISLVLNNQVVLYNYELNHQKKKIKVKLQSGANELIMVAHNEGTVKPNSAAIEIKSGLKKYGTQLNSSMNSSAVIDLNYLYEP